MHSVYIKKNCQDKRKIIINKKIFTNQYLYVTHVKLGRKCYTRIHILQTLHIQNKSIALLVGTMNNLIKNSLSEKGLDQVHAVW